MQDGVTRRKYTFPRTGEFLIVRYHTQLIFSGSDGGSWHNWGYVRCQKNCTGLKEAQYPYVAKLREITKEDALAAIEQYGLVPVLTEKGDRIYDTPDGAFKAKYGGLALIDDRILL